MTNSCNARSPATPFPQRKHLAFGLALFSAAAAYGSLAPFAFQSQGVAEAAAEFLARLPTTWWHRDGLADLGANVLLFVPLGYFGLGVLTVDRVRFARNVAMWLAVYASGVALSVLLEFSQVWCVDRVASWRDVLAQSAGCLAGCLIWATTGQRTVNWTRSQAAAVPGTCRIVPFLPWYAIALAIYRLAPLDMTFSPRQLRRKFRQGRIVAWPFVDLHDWTSLMQHVFDASLCLPLGMLVAALWRVPGSGWMRPGGRLLLSALFVGAYESAQLLVYSRFTSTTDWILGTAFAWVGAWLMDRRLATSAAVDARSQRAARRNALAMLLLAIVYASFVVGIFLFPFDWDAQAEQVAGRWERIVRVPFAALLRGPEIGVTGELGKKLALFAPLGLCGVYVVDRLVGPGTGRRTALAAWVVACTVLAIGIECAQVYLPSHTPDLSDAALASVGVVLGMWFARRW